MNRRISWLITIFWIITVLAAGCQTAKKPDTTPKKQTQEATNAPTNLIKAAEQDPNTNGCVSCHKKEGDVDRSLPVYVKRISGHPEVKETTVNACYVCHDPQKNFGLYKRFLRGIHKIHWESETFYDKLKGRCYSCHTVETNGVSGIKNYPPAGYREGDSKTNGGTAAPKENAANNQGTQKTEKEDSAKQPEEQNRAQSGGNDTNNSTVEVPTPTP